MCKKFEDFDLKSLKDSETLTLLRAWEEWV